MSNYALIRDGQIVERHDVLPNSWENVSGLQFAKDNEELLNSIGWYTVQKAPVQFDANTQFISDNTYAFINNTVTETPVVSDKDPSQVIDFKTPFLNNLRNIRNSLLTQSDWTQATDVQKIKSIEWVNAWVVYRQALRDLPAQYETIDITISTQVILPTIPPTT